LTLLTRISSFFKNKYLIALCLFAAIIFFFDKNDIFTQVARTQQLRQLEGSRQYYMTQIASEQKELEKLRTNPATLEKYAREKYLMKRDNEDLFLVPEKPEKAKN
jgi:cell division protein DivIC